MGRKAPRKRLAYRVMIRPTGASHAPERLSALRPPLDSGWRSKVANPGRKNAPRERDGLFDIVSCEVRDPRPEERACASAPAKSNARARVSKDEDSTRSRVYPRSAKLSAQVGYSRLGCAWPSCFETHRSALGLWKRLRSRLAAMLLSMRANQPAAVGNDRWFALPVSGLLFTGNAATSACRAASAVEA